MMENNYNLIIENKRFTVPISNVVKLLKHYSLKKANIICLDIKKNIIGLEIKQDYGNTILSILYNGYKVFDEKTMSKSLIDKINNFDKVKSWDFLIKLKNDIDRECKKHGLVKVKFKPMYDLFIITNANNNEYVGYGLSKEIKDDGIIELDKENKLKINFPLLKKMKKSVFLDSKNKMFFLY